MRFYFPFVTLLVCAAAQSTILVDLNQNIAPQITKLSADVEGFPDSGLDGALAIDTDSKDLVNIFDSAAENARNEGSFSFADGVTILADLSPITNTMTGILDGLSAKKDDFNQLVLPAGSLILSDLQKLNQSSIEYLDALVADSPTAQVPPFVAVRTTWASAFAQTLADYASEA
ncbi:hypothetical protein ATEIFO6365_0010041800 [Aspergillus terreus]|uniref:Uncharacterized protein n=1 Tax=Aspergillus terreus TaxID=33178 RepID=A0A5M3ZAB4_ASPTE|nr:hypothetical protein ATETN484_0012040000 [Aspergillus terreus]GFF19638.1 hypothetical protein ATEIFO6365_0010041800 [Aspergillus terreus]